MGRAGQDRQTEDGGMVSKQLTSRSLLFPSLSLSLSLSLLVLTVVHQLLQTVGESPQGQSTICVLATAADSTEP